VTSRQINTSDMRFRFRQILALLIEYFPGRSSCNYLTIMCNCVDHGNCPNHSVFVSDLVNHRYVLLTKEHHTGQYFTSFTRRFTKFDQTDFPVPDGNTVHAIYTIII
jgi:hypothetical protein